MTLKDLAQPEPWMTQEEGQTAATLIAAFQQNFVDRNIPENPFLTLRLQDCLLHHTLCRRLEQALIADAEALTPALAAHIGRARERFRKALKSLEDTANKLAPPADPSPQSTAKGNQSAESPNSPATSIPDNTPQGQNQNATPAVPPSSPSTVPPLPPMTPIPPPATRPQAVIHVPRPIPLAQQHRDK